MPVVRSISGKTKIEIHIRMPKPGLGISYSGQLLDEIAEKWLRGERLPNRIVITALLWRWNNGPWKEARTPVELRKARDDFRFITYSGCRFTTAETVSPLG